jgi:hypothetical protein
MKHYIIHFWIESFKVERKKTKLNPKINGEKKISEKCYFRSYRRDPGRSLGGSQGDQREMNFFGIDGHQFAAYFGSVLR